MNVASLFEKCAQRHGPVLALRELGSGRELSFAELHEALRRVGASLDAAGIAVGSRVALLGGSDVDYLLCDYGVMAAGRVRVPLDPALNADEQAAQLSDSDATLLLHSPQQAGRAAELAHRLPGLRTLPQAGMDGHPAKATFCMAPDAAALASLSYTGGTTGSPKAVMVTHGSLSAAVQNIVGARGMGPDDVMLNVRPTWPIAAVVLLAHLAAGGTLLLGDKFEPHAFLQLLEKHRVAATSLVPTHLARLMDEVDPALHRLPRLRTIDVGAAAIPAELFTRLLAGFGPRIGVLYGLTEAPWSCYLPPAAFDVAPELRQERMRCVGRALFGVEVIAQSPEGQPMPAGVEGEITLRGAHVAAGYWRRPDVGADAFRDGWFHTGDLGSVGADGYVRITGRLKELVRTGGKSVVPAEVEAALLAHPAVAEVAVFGLPDAEWGEVVAAAVVTRPGTAPSQAELIDWCRERLSSFKKPRHVFFVTEIPRSHYGKPLRAKLRDRLLAASSSSQKEPAP